MQAKAKAIQEVAKLVFFWQMTRTQEGGWKFGMPLKPEFRSGTVTSPHIPLARLSHEAKHEVSGVGRLLPPTEKHGKNRQGRKDRKQIQSASEIS